MSHPPSFCVAGVGQMALSDALRPGFGACDAAVLCAAGVAQPHIHPHFTWQAWHKLTSIVVLRGRRGTYGIGWRPWARIWRLWRRGTLRGRRGPNSHPPSFCVAGVALMVLGGALGPGFGACDAASLCVAGKAQPHIHLRFTWQAWHKLASTVVLRAYHFVTHHLSHTVTDYLSHTIFHTPSFTHRLCHTPSFTHNFVTHQLCHTPSFTHQLYHTPSFTHLFVTTHLSYTIFHTSHCHTPSFTHHFVTYHLWHTALSHTTLSHTIFHTPSSTHHFVTRHLSPHHPSHTTLSHTIFHHTIFHTQLCRTPSFTTPSLTQLCHTPYFAKPSFTHHFVTHHLSHTTLSHALFHTQPAHPPSFTHHFVTHTIFLSHTPTFTYNFVTHNFVLLLDPPPPPLSFLPSPSPLQHLVLIIQRSCVVGLSGPLIIFLIFLKNKFKIL